MILYKGSGVPLKIAIARTAEEILCKRFEAEAVITTVTTAERNKWEGPRPTSSFVILNPDAVFETKSHIAMPFGRRKKQPGAVAPGDYLVQVQVSTWPESADLARTLRDRWKKWGYLSFEPITSIPMALTIEQNAKLERCE